MAKFKVGDRVVQDKEVGGTDLVKHWNMFWKSAEGDVTDGTFFVTSVTEGYTHYSNRAGGNGPMIEHKYLKLAPLKIEAGKFYKTRDGRKVGPIQWHIGVGGWIVSLGDGSAWDKDGTVRAGALIRSDLVAEWVDEPKAENDNEASSKPKFKVGDVVKIIDASGGGSLGQVLTIKRVVADDFCVPYYEFSNSALGLYEYRLSPVDTRPTAIVCLIENAQPKPSVNPFVHSSAEAAATEAARLAGKYRGKKFGVYVLSSTEELAAPTYKHKWQRLAAQGEKIAAIKELRGITGLGLKATKDAVEHWLANDEPASRIAA